MVFITHGLQLQLAQSKSIPKQMMHRAHASMNLAWLKAWRAPSKFTATTTAKVKKREYIYSMTEWFSPYISHTTILVARVFFPHCVHFVSILYSVDRYFCEVIRWINDISHCWGILTVQFMAIHGDLLCMLENMFGLQQIIHIAHSQ